MITISDIKGGWVENMMLQKDDKYYIIKEVKTNTIICELIGGSETLELPKLNEYAVISMPYRY